jgi:hypothetical protein
MLSDIQCHHFWPQPEPATHILSWGSMPALFRVAAAKSQNSGSSSSVTT